MEDSLYASMLKYGMEGIIFGGFILVLKWVFTINKEIITSMGKEREAWQLMTKGFSENIKENTENTKEFKRSVEETHNFQRSEHKEMIEILGRINGHKQ